MVNYGLGLDPGFNKAHYSELLNATGSPDDRPYLEEEK
ncbi:hypothetical protein HNR48_002771 [Pseudoteredinibacter isoporae]|uniref:Uncharacterized protein n=1 Tax=Pseudoteredinibacter isoporae TaxID=570281 RepID=A0A7X0JWC2_9GAMM|nr:hypothetical protein [Pseudoteredinibacter isoporae]